MTKTLHVVCGALTLLMLAAGCMHSGYEGETYPATDSVQLFSRNQAIPAGYSVMGRAWVSGELSGTTRPELEERLQKMAMNRGADAVVIIGSIIRQDGMKINDAAQDFTDATDSPAQAQLKLAVDKDMKDFSETNREKRFERIIVADFLHRDLPAKK